MQQRILARRSNPKNWAPESDWIESEVRLLGKSFGGASRSIQEEIDEGTMIIVDKEGKEIT